jgi:hypothetical protein
MIMLMKGILIGALLAFYLVGVYLFWATVRHLP